MKTIDIKSKKYPNTIIKVSDIDYEAVSAQKWYVSIKKDGTKRIIATIKDGFGKTTTMQLIRFIHQRRMGYKVDGQKMHKDGDSLNFTRKNVVKLKEEEVIKFLLKRDILDNRYDSKQNGNNFCNALEANLKLRENWGV